MIAILCAFTLVCKKIRLMLLHICSLPGQFHLIASSYVGRVMIRHRLPFRGYVRPLLMFLVFAVW